MAIKQMELDVLKPIEELSNSDLIERVVSLEGVEEAELKLLEIDKDVENVLIKVKGRNLKIDKLEETLKKAGATLHSVDLLKAESK